MIYCIMFLISLIFIYIGTKLEKKNKIFAYVFEIIGILLPCLLAAFRATTIGTDTDVYVTKIFDAACKEQNGFIHFIQHPNSKVKEILYLSITYISAKISSNVGVLLFINELLVIAPVFIALKRKNKGNGNALLLGMFLFYTFFYNMSLNIARQSIAISFTILAFSFIDENKIKFIALGIVAFLFHRTAIILAPIFILYIFLDNDKIKDKNKVNTKIFILISLVLGIIFFKQILNSLVNMGVFSKYFTKILKNYVRDKLDFNQFNTIIYTAIYVIIYINKAIFSKKDKNYSFYKYLSLLSIGILQLGGIIQFSDRIGYYILFPTVFLLLPKLVPCNFKENKKEFYRIIPIVAVFSAYWAFWIWFQNVHETNPYLLR